MEKQEIPGGSVDSGSSTVTIVALVTAVAQVQFLPWELPHPADKALQKKKVLIKSVKVTSTYFRVKQVY